MKTILTLFILLALIVPVSAQSTFAPTGSEWYHSMLVYGAFHSYNDGDTVIAGTSCRKIVRHALTKQPFLSEGLQVQDNYTMYVYNTADTVFIYNGFFNRFTPLYVFNVNDGDTVRLPIIPIDVNLLAFISTDSTFSFRVDSVRMKLYDTVMLKTVYTHSFGNTASNYVYYYGYGPGNPYADKIGCVLGGLIPRGLPGVNLNDDAVEFQDSLRCYNDPGLSVKLTAGECELPSEDVVAVQKRAATIFPNPASDVVHIIGKDISAEMCDATGRRVFRPISTVNGLAAIPVSTLPPGIYLLKITTNGLVSEYRKVSVVH